MKRRNVLLGTGTLAATALAGCLGSAQEGDGDDSSGGPTRTISVSATGQVEEDPDLAVIQASVEATGEDIDSVRDELGAQIDELYDALVEYGIDEDNITTGNFNIRTRIDERRIEEEDAQPDSEEELREYMYYDGSHSLTIEVETVEDAGEVVDTAVDAGADSIGRITFTLSEEKREELREAALEKAIEDARREADFVAGEVDASVIEASKIDTSGSGVRPYRTEVAMDDVEDGASASTTLHPDDVTVSASVDITYEIQ